MLRFIKSTIKILKQRMNLLFFWLRIKGVIIYDKQKKLYFRDIRGHSFYLHSIDSGISRDLAKNGIREKESVEALSNYVKPNMNILEFGANIGFYVIQEAEIISKGSGTIYALEPSLANIRLLNINVACNNYTEKVKVIHGAICDHTGWDEDTCHTFERCWKIVCGPFCFCIPSCAVRIVLWVSCWSCPHKDIPARH